MAMDGRRVEVVEAVEVSIRGLGFEFLSCVGMLIQFFILGMGS